MILTHAAMSEFGESAARGVSLPRASFVDHSITGTFPGTYEVFPAEEFTSIGNTTGDERTYIAFNIRPVTQEAVEESNITRQALSDRLNKAAGSASFHALFRESAGQSNRVHETRTGARAEAARLNQETYDRYLTDCQTHALAGVTGWLAKAPDNSSSYEQTAVLPGRQLTAA